MIHLTIEFLIQNTAWSIFIGSLIVCLVLVVKRRPALIHLACVLAMIAMLTPPLLSIALPTGDLVYKHASGERQQLGTARQSCQIQ